MARYVLWNPLSPAVDDDTWLRIYRNTELNHTTNDTLRAKAAHAIMPLFSLPKCPMWHHETVLMLSSQFRPHYNLVALVTIFVLYP